MRELILIGSGSFVGGVARYYLGALVPNVILVGRFPLGTLVVNLIGCFLLGVVGELSDRYQLISPLTRLAIVTGLLGGFTTFSAFGYETISLMRDGEFFLGALNIVLSVFLGLLAVWFGMRLMGVLISS